MNQRSIFVVNEVANLYLLHQNNQLVHLHIHLYHLARFESHQVRDF